MDAITTTIPITFLFIFYLNDICFLDVITGNWLKERREPKEKEQNAMKSNNVKSYAIFNFVSKIGYLTNKP